IYVWGKSSYICLGTRFHFPMRKGSVSLPSLMGYTKARTSGSALQGTPWQRGRNEKNPLLINFPQK
ncbi:MAG: hypothetical protein ACKPGT_06030, partial [Microcystis sp.]